MDKYQELLNAIKVNYGEHSEFYKTTKELVDKAKKYDEKETPKKVKAEIMSDYVEYHYVQSYEIYVCPVCGLHLSPTQNYCDRCSQKLDWSDEDV